MILVIDNYDSFTYNLVHLLGELGAEVTVYRNDAIDLAGVRALRPERILVGPGPCTPDQAGISLQLIRELGPEVPILGVCLGHQCIGQAYGGRVVRAPELMHGKVSPIRHCGEGLFERLPNPVRATRYHSLVVERESVPGELVVTAETADGLVMGLRHREHPVHGVQFHPESILTESGKTLLENFLRLPLPAALRS